MLVSSTRRYHHLQCIRCSHQQSSQSYYNLPDGELPQWKAKPPAWLWEHTELISRRKSAHLDKHLSFGNLHSVGGMCKFTFECLFWKHLYSFHIKLKAISMRARKNIFIPRYKLHLLGLSGIFSMSFSWVSSTSIFRNIGNSFCISFIIFLMNPT